MLVLPPPERLRAEGVPLPEEGRDPDELLGAPAVPEGVLGRDGAAAGDGLEGAGRAGACPEGSGTFGTPGTLGAGTEGAGSFGGDAGTDGTEGTGTDGSAGVGTGSGGTAGSGTWACAEAAIVVASTAPMASPILFISRDS